MSYFKLVCALSLVLFNQVTLAAIPYAQLSSSKNQITSEEDINKNIPIIMQNINYIEGLSWDNKENKLSISEDGMYFIMAVAQMGSRESAKLNDKGGDAFYWFEINGKPVKDSSEWVHISPSAKSNTVITQYILPLKKGDSLQFIYSTTAASIGLVTFRGTEYRPSSAGLTLSVFKVAEIPLKE